MKIIVGGKRPGKWREVYVLRATSLFVEPSLAESPPTVKKETRDEASNMLDVERRDRQFFIEQKLSSLHTAGNVCMTWWVSSVVFCGTILAAVWLQREDLRQSTFMMWTLFGVLFIFFAGVTGFGYHVIRYLEKFKADLSRFPEGSDESLLFSTELKFFSRGMWIGTICFAVILFAWIAFWLALWLFDCCPSVRPSS